MYIRITEWTVNSGNYFEHVAQGGGAEKAGVNIGDRIIEINRQSLEGISHERVIEMIKGSGESVEMTILSSSKEMPGIRSGKFQVLCLFHFGRQLS